MVVRSLRVADGSAIESVDQTDTITYRTRLRFERPVVGPQVNFRVLAEDGTLAYGRASTIGDAWRSFADGDEAEVAVTFRPRFGGGGTFRIAMIVTDNDYSNVLLHDQGGPSFFVPPQIGVQGVADLGAEIDIDGEHRTNHASLRFDGRAAVDGT